MKIQYITTFLFLLTLPLYSHNNLYLPGDSFFPGTILKYDSSQKKLTLEYKMLTSRIAMCGYLGYEKLIISDVDEKDYKLLLSMVEDSKTRSAKSVQVEERSVVLSEPLILVYNKTFDLSNHLLLRYNEDKEAIEKKRRNVSRLDHLLNEALVKINKEHSRSISPLKVGDIGKELEGFMEAESQPLKASRKDLKFVVVPPCYLRDLAMKKEPKTMMVLDEGKKALQYK